MYDKGYTESYIRVKGAWVPLMRYRELKADLRRELVKAICFAILILVVMFGMLWLTP